MPHRELRIGSRGSLLAVAQRAEVVNALKERNPDIEIREVNVKTSGDLRPDAPVSSIGKSVFVSELQKALINGEIDVAVHSMKDLPTTEPAGLTIAAVPYREDPRDVVISRSGETLEDLPSGSIVATGSPRRCALINIKRPDLVLHRIRGNVNTRLALLDSGRLQIDALVLAAAGLKRLGLESRISQYLICTRFTAAPAQGAIAVECRADDTKTIAICSELEHTESRIRVNTERAFVREIGAGCNTPIGAHARIEDGKVMLATFISNPSATAVHTGRSHFEVSSSESGAAEYARETLANGAEEWVSESRDLV